MAIFTGGMISWPLECLFRTHAPCLQVSTLAVAAFDWRGIPPEVLENTISLPPNDIESVETLLGSRSDIAAVILEPAGGLSAAIQTVPG